jgi:tetratricopeptide (TPR) repeat protein
VPLRSVAASSRAVFDLAQRTGDFEYGSYAAHMATYMALAAGQPLVPLRDDALWLGQQIRSFGQINAIHLHAPFEQLLKGLTGTKAEPWNLDDEHFSEAAALAAAEATDARGSICVHRVAMGLARFFAGRVREASEQLEVARTYLDAVPSCWMVPLCHQFAALSACAAWDEFDDATRTRLRLRIEESLSALRELSAQAPINFAHRVLLVEGELQRVDGAADSALRSFERALTLASANDWVGDVAITHELMARALQALGRPREAADQLASARATYTRWGVSLHGAT